MEFIATYWYLWLIGMFLCYGAAVYIQIQQIKRISGQNLSSLTMESMENSSREFAKRMGQMMLAGLLGTGFAALLLISVVVNIILYTQGR